MTKPPVLRSRPTSSTELLRCVVLENGSRPLTDAGAQSFDQTLVMAQMHGELPALFAQRTLERLASIERSGRRLEAATLLTGDQHDSASNAARRLIAMGLSASAQAHHAGHPVELTLCAARGSSPAHRAELLSLAEEVMALSGGEHVPVRVRFDEAKAPPPRRQSGIFSAIVVKPSRGHTARR
jgi:hypothetical protein